MKGSYYQNMSRAGEDLRKWLMEGDKRAPWREVTRAAFLRYGFGDKKMRQILKEISPRFSINDQGELVDGDA